MNTRALKNKVVPFKFVPFSRKQMKILCWWQQDSPYKNYDTIIADGSVRSGKTVSLALSYVMWAMETFNGCNLAFCGKTIYATRRNVINPLKQMLKSRKYIVIDCRSDNMLIICLRKRQQDGTIKETINYFYIFGGSDESSQDVVQGITLAGAFLDEVALMPQSFVNQVTARCSVEGAKFWFSCNPADPFHWFKKEWIDMQEEKKILYLHFTMDDNPSLSERVKARYKTLYVGVFYRRYIEGLWVLAEGAVFPMFNEETHCTDYDRPWTRTFISCDFGILNPMTFGIYGYYSPEKHYHLIDRYYHDGRNNKLQRNKNCGIENVGQKTVKEYVEDLTNWIKTMMFKPEYVTVDPSAAALIVELRKDPYLKRRKIKIIPAKNSVMVGIQFMSYLLTINKFTIFDSEFDKEEFSAYVWDTNRAEKDGKEQVIKQNDHCMDSNRYALLTDSILYKTYKEERGTLEKRKAGMTS